MFFFKGVSPLSVVCSAGNVDALSIAVILSALRSPFSITTAQTFPLKVLWMSADLRTLFSSSIVMLGIYYLGVGLDMSQRRFPKDDVTDGHDEVTKMNDFYCCIS